MLVMNVGIKKEIREVHPLKALSGMEVHVLGVVMADCSQQPLQIEKTLGLHVRNTVGMEEVG